MAKVERLYDGRGLWRWMVRYYRQIEEPADEGVVSSDDMKEYRPRVRKRGRRLQKGPVGKYGTLNGRRLTKTDERYLYRMRRGRVRRISLGKIDHFCTYYELPLWEAMLAAGETEQEREELLRADTETEEYDSAA